MYPKRNRKPSLKVKENQELMEQVLLRKIREAEEKRKGKAERKKKARALQLQSETPEKRQERLQAMSDRRYARLQSETPEKTQERLQYLSQRRSARLQSETPEKRQERLQDLSQRQSFRRQSETPESRHKRLHEESHSKKRKRHSRTAQEVAEESAAKRARRRGNVLSQNIEDASRSFLAAVRDGPDYVCTCCHRLMYRKTVVEFNRSKFSKLPDHFIHAVFPPELIYTSAQQKVWICKTCNNTVKRGRMPVQAKANSLVLEKVPAELSDLNPMEVRLVSLRIPFMKMVALPCGKQRAIHGPAVNVPTDLHPVCNLLPRLPSEAQVVPMKLKRKLCYKGHYMFQCIRPAKVLAALEWLKANNPLYHDVQINMDWEQQAAHDDADLWEAFTSQQPHQSSSQEEPQQPPLSSQEEPQQPHQPIQQETEDQPEATTVDIPQHSSCVQDETPHRLMDCIDEGTSTITSLATERGFIVRDVGRDGDCLFHAVQLQLQKLGIEVHKNALRQQLASYLEEHPYTSDGSCHLMNFLSQAVQSNNPFNADTEQPTEEDERIAAVADPDTRQQLLWCKYLRRLRSSAWGDHIAVQGLADMLHVDIHILATLNPNMEPITTCSSPRGVLHLGLIGQFHYVSLNQVDSGHSSEAQQHSPSSYHQELVQVQAHCQSGDQSLSGDSPVPENNSGSTPGSDSQEDTEQADNEAAFTHQYEQRGLPYDTVMHCEDVEVGDDGIFSVAPGEGQKPIAILTDELFEEMCNPTKYPGGSFGLMAQRERKITVRKYFNQRLLDVDGRFARDIEYLLTAQYAVESKQVADDASIVLRQSQGRQYRGQPLTAGSIQNQSVLLQMIQRDEAYRFLKNVRGSPAYFQRVMYEVLAMIRQLGLPTWFLTVSAADMQWPDVIQTIAKQYGYTYTDEEVAAMPFEERSKWLNQNPVTAARHFQYRLTSFIQIFLKSKAHPLGELSDYSIRIEFQARGSPHAHSMLWIKGAPKLGVNTDQEICDFIDRYVSCNIPEDEDSARLVSKVQKHRHSATCMRNGRCRFHIPRPPSPATVIARESNRELCSTEEAEEAAAALLKVKKTLDDPATPDSISFDELLVKASVSEEVYLRGLKICYKGASIVIKRAPQDSWINAYNLEVIKVWKANMDIQFILDPYACVMYITSYMLKSEGAMSELLRRVAMEFLGEAIKASMKRLGSVFLNHRELSAQEAVYRLLSLPLKMLSRKVIFINASPKEERVSLLKPANQLENLDEESEDIYQTSLIDRYAARPDSLSNMCLAEFAANYTTRSGADPEEGESNDTLPPPEPEDAGKSARIQLKNGLGYMYKRTKEAVIRFHRFNLEKEASKLYRSKLMLYLPWRDESTDLLGGYMDYRSRYEDLSDDILANEQKYSQNAALIGEAMDDLHEHGPPQHAWDQLAPGAVEEDARHRAEGVEEERSIEQEDLDANARLLQQQQQTSTPLLQRFTAETNREVLSPDDYRAAVRGLNTKQKQVVMFHRAWCKRAVIALRSGQPIGPYRVFVSGPGGVGKSHVISIIRSDTVKLLRLSGKVQPDEVIALLTAPTGSASFNIEGMTLHSGLLLSTSRGSSTPLTQDKLNTLRLKLSNLQLLIIDEVSMVGSNMLLQIHKRLQQLKGSKDDATFGNVSILAVGDLYQLQPVAQPYIFDPVSDLYARLHRSGSLWSDEFLMVELDEIMRQRGDQQFAQLLCRVRKAECTDEDFDMLKSRALEDSSPDYPHEALHVYRLNKDVDQYNTSKLNHLAPQDQQVVIHAIDSTRDRHTSQLGMTMPKSKADTGGLVSELHLAVGAKVMLTVNIDVSDGLVNGARGTVEAIISTGNQVTFVLVSFDHERVGVTAISRSHYRDEHPRAVPISRHEAVFNIGRNKAAEVSRRQFPLVLAWATTIHKVQGLTLDQIVVDMKGQAFNAGQAYVAFSRVKTLLGLFIKNFNPNSIKVSASVVAEMERLNSDKLLPSQPVPQVITLPTLEWIKIGHLNVRSYRAKLDDVGGDECIAHTNIMCFTETHLKPHHDVSSLTLNGASSVVFRCDRAGSSTQSLSNGGVLVACASSLQPQCLNIQHPPSLEVVSIVVNTHSNLDLCVVAIYRRPQLPISTFLPLLEDYLQHLPHQHVPTVILGDFNENLLSSIDSRLLQRMSSYGFTQLVQHPTTDSGSLLDHIYYNQSSDAVVDVIDTYYSDHDACFLSLHHQQSQVLLSSST